MIPKKIFFFKNAMWESKNADFYADFESVMKVEKGKKLLTKK
jgi:hypothetical protein